MFRLPLRMDGSAKCSQSRMSQTKQGGPVGFAMLLVGGSRAVREGLVGQGSDPPPPNIYRVSERRKQSAGEAANVSERGMGRVEYNWGSTELPMAKQKSSTARTICAHIQADGDKVIGKKNNIPAHSMKNKKNGKMSRKGDIFKQKRGRLWGGIPGLKKLFYALVVFDAQSIRWPILWSKNGP